MSNTGDFGFFEEPIWMAWDIVQDINKQVTLGFLI